MTNVKKDYPLRKLMPNCPTRCAKGLQILKLKPFRKETKHEGIKVTRIWHFVHKRGMKQWRKLMWLPKHYTHCFHNQLFNTTAYTAAKLEFNTGLFKKAKQTGNISVPFWGVLVWVLPPEVHPPVAEGQVLQLDHLKQLMIYNDVHQMCQAQLLVSKCGWVTAAKR